MSCTRCQIQTFTPLCSNGNQIRTRVMGHAGARGTFYFFIYHSNQWRWWKRKKLQKKLENISKHRDTISARGSSNSDNQTWRDFDLLKHGKDRLSHKQILTIRRQIMLERGCKVVLRAHYEVGWQGQVTGMRHGGISELERDRGWTRG